MKRSLLMPAFAGLMLLAFFSCRKSTFIGDELIPDGDFLNSERSDTFTIITQVLQDDSAVTNRNLFYSLGSINEGEQFDQFGKTFAHIYTQVNLPTNNLFLGDGAIADSAVLILDYAGLYGDSTAKHSVSVYKLIDDLNINQNYYSDTRLHYLPIAIGRKDDFIPNLKDSIQGYSFKYAPSLRIRLSDWFADELINQNDTIKFINDTTFTNFLKGLYIETDTAELSQSIMLFNMSSFISGITLYYKNATADSLSVSFPFNGPIINSYTHNFEGSQASASLTNPVEEEDSIIYLQGFTGLKTYIQIPYLENLEGVSINKAELTFTVINEPESGLFALPPRLLFIESDTLLKNKYTFIDYGLEYYWSVVDQFISSYDYGGALDTLTEISGQQQSTYKFNLTRHFQEIIDGDIENNGFQLIVFPGYRIPNSVILGGSGSIYEPKLSITYTHINQ